MSRAKPAVRINPGGSSVHTHTPGPGCRWRAREGYEWEGMRQGYDECKILGRLSMNEWQYGDKRENERQQTVEHTNRYCPLTTNYVENPVGIWQTHWDGKCTQKHILLYSIRSPCSLLVVVLVNVNSMAVFSGLYSVPKWVWFFNRELGSNLARASGLSGKADSVPKERRSQVISYVMWYIRKRI